MSKNDKLTRVICGYSKIPDESGLCSAEVEYMLKPIPIELLRKMFNYKLTEDGIIDYNLIYCYQINESHAKILQDYVIDEVLDLNKYDFMLECYAD